MAFALPEARLRLRGCGLLPYRLAHPHGVPVIRELFTAIQTYNVGSVVATLRGKSRASAQGREWKTGVSVTAPKKRIEQRLEHFDPRD